MLRYLITEPRDALGYILDRVLCLTLNRHGRSCRGRTDHDPARHHAPRR